MSNTILTDIQELDYKELQSAYHTMINALRNTEIKNKQVNKEVGEYILNIRELQKMMLYLLGECEYKILDSSDNLNNRRKRRLEYLKREHDAIEQLIQLNQPRNG
jgi:hypothetical protein